MNNLISIQRRLSDYNCTSSREEDQALREILQDLILAALGRTEFFFKAAFHGGTHLRIFPDATIKKAFLKDDSFIRILNLKFLKNIGSRQTPKKLRIKLEVDSNPPAGAVYESLALSFPFPSSVTAFDLPSSFAGKMHALLCREYVKGRDWYDFIWYSGTRVKLNHELLSAALDQNGAWAGKHLKTSDEWVRDELKRKIASLDWRLAREDVEPFIHRTELASLEYFNAEYFMQLADRIVSA